VDEGAHGPLAREGGLSLDKLFAGAHFLVTPLLTGPVCLISRGWFEEPIHPLHALYCILKSFYLSD